MASPRVAVVILNWNSAPDTIACLQSLRQQGYPALSILVIDNGSADDSVSLLRGVTGGGCVLIEAGRNLGFPAACNVGARRALAEGADYVFLLNNDTELAADAIGRLVQVAEADRAIGAVTPKILFFEPRDLVWYGGGTFDDRYIVGRQVGYLRPDDGSYDAPSDVPWATGCAMLISRAALGAVGLLNEDYFFGAEDLDYSLRLTSAGFRVRYAPDAVIWHKEAAAAGGRNAPAYVYYQVRNVLLLRRLHARGIMGRLSAGAFSLAWIVKRSVRFAARGQWRCVAATAYGILDHLRGSYGPLRHQQIAFRLRVRKS